MVKRVLKWLSLSLLVVIVLVGAAIGIVLNVVFTPEKLTPIVEKYANEYLDADVRFQSIDLTFYSTFPNFTLDVRDGSVVTKVFQGTGRDTCFVKTDSLVNFKRCKITVNPLAFLSRQDIIVRRLILVKPNIYAYIDTNGMPGWNILRPTVADTLAMAEDASTDTLSSGKFTGKIDIRRIRVIDGNIVFDDRANRLYSRLEGVNLNLSAAYEGVKADLEMELGMKNCILWQEGNVLVRRTSLGIETGLRVDRDSLLCVLDKTVCTVNGIKFGVGGRLQADTLNHVLNTDLTFGIKVPSLDVLLNLVPENILKHDKKAEVGGSVAFGGTLKGAYGKDRFPVLQARFRVTDGQTKYAGMPYALEQLDVDLEGLLDFQKQQPSYVKVNKLRVKGQSVDIDLEGKVEQLLVSPRVLAKLKADINFDLIPKIFPLSEGIS